MLKHRRLLPPRPRAWAFLPYWLPLLARRAGSDTAPPAFVAAEAGDVANVVVAVRLSEALTSPGADYAAGTTIQVNAVTASIVSAALQGDQRTIHFTLAAGEAADADDLITWEYSATTGDLEDLAGNPLGDLDETVTNHIGEHWRFDHPANTMQLAAL